MSPMVQGGFLTTGPEEVPVTITDLPHQDSIQPQVAFEPFGLDQFLDLYDTDIFY